VPNCAERATATSGTVRKCQPGHTEEQRRCYSMPIEPFRFGELSLKPHMSAASVSRQVDPLIPRAWSKHGHDPSVQAGTISHRMSAPAVSEMPHNQSARPVAIAASCGLPLLISEPLRLAVGGNQH
jgi:hypothetical protein